MDTTQEGIKDLLDRLEQSRLDTDYTYSDSTNNFTIGSDTITIRGLGATGSSIDMNDGTWSNLNISGGITGTYMHPNANVTLGGGNVGAVWTTSGTSTGINWNQSAVGGIYASNPMTVNQGGKVSLKGENADVDINGKSLVKWMEAMEERMNWMQPNVELEKEWDDLKKLGDRYRKLEAKCKEKAEMWKKLKSMPKPNINI